MFLLLIRFLFLFRSLIISFLRRFGSCFLTFSFLLAHFRLINQTVICSIRNNLFIIIISCTVGHYLLTSFVKNSHTHTFYALECAWFCILKYSVLLIFLAAVLALLCSVLLLLLLFTTLKYLSQHNINNDNKLYECLKKIVGNIATST